MKRTSEDIVKNVLTKIIKHISIIAIFMAIAVMTVLYFGPEVSLDLRFFTRLTVASIVLCISIIIIYELWSKTGQDKARSEKEYIEVTTEFDRLSSNIDYATMQDYLDYEEKRRYNVEYDKYTKLILRDSELLKKIQEDIQKRKETASMLNPNKKSDKKLLRKLLHVSLEDRWKIRLLTKRIKNNNKRRTSIYIKLPYVKSEEFDYLRYNINTEGFKEYTPDDTKKYMRIHRTKKYIQSITLALFGVNMLSFGSTISGNYWYAAIMTLLTIVSLVIAVVSGFSVGYKSIAIVSTGVYKTANEYINKAIVYCERNDKGLYYKETPVYEYESLENKDTIDEKPEVEEVKVEETIIEQKTSIDIS